MAGDIPNFVLTMDADGTAHATTTAHYVTLVSDNNSYSATAERRS